MGVNSIRHESRQILGLWAFSQNNQKSRLANCGMWAAIFSIELLTSIVACRAGRRKTAYEVEHLFPGDSGPGHMPLLAGQPYAFNRYEAQVLSGNSQDRFGYRVADRGNEWM